jgi:hypothetical protein
MVDVCPVEEGDQDIDVQQGAHHAPSLSRRRSMSLFVTGRPRDAKGRNPPVALVSWPDDVA